MDFPWDKHKLYNLEDIKNFHGQVLNLIMKV